MLLLKELTIMCGVHVSCTISGVRPGAGVGYLSPLFQSDPKLVSNMRNTVAYTTDCISKVQQTGTTSEDFKTLQELTSRMEECTSLLSVPSRLRLESGGEYSFQTLESMSGSERSSGRVEDKTSETGVSDSGNVQSV